MGKLKPDLTAEEYVEKRGNINHIIIEKYERQQNYSKEVELRNKVQINKQPKQSSRVTVKEQSKREKV